MWIKEVEMVSVFENFFKKPFITSINTKNLKKLSSFRNGVIENIKYLLNTDNSRWFLENFVWFYDKKILQDLFNEFGTPFELANKIQALKDEKRITSGIFEIELYQNFVYLNAEKYGYKKLDSGKLLKDALSEKEYNLYFEKYFEIFRGGCGLLENTMLLLNKENYKELAEMHKNNNFNIIRCEYTDINNIDIQSSFINIAEPIIFAASQEHLFGINNPKSIIYKNLPYKKLVEITKTLKLNLKLISKLISITKYSILFIIYAVRGILYVTKKN